MYIFSNKTHYAYLCGLMDKSMEKPDKVLSFKS